MLKKTLSSLILLALRYKQIAKAKVLEAFDDKAAGIYSWCNWSPKRYNRETAPDLRGVAIVLNWSKLEPSECDYQFDRRFGELLQKAHDNDYYVHIMIWVAPSTPEWVYKQGIPKVKTDRKTNALGEATNAVYFPYYLDAGYQKKYFKLLKDWAKYIDKLPDELHRRILFVQSCEGSTGDGWGYKENH